jgi:hypothetical protein
MSNIETIFPKEGFSSPSNNLFISSTDSTTAYIKIGDDVIGIPLTKVDEIESGLHYTNTGNNKDLLDKKLYLELVKKTNTYRKVDGKIDTKDNLSLDYNNKDVYGFLFSKKDIELKFSINNSCILLINNLIIKESGVTKISKNILIPIRMIFCDGKITFNNKENIFYIPKGQQ